MQRAAGAYAGAVLKTTESEAVATLRMDIYEANTDVHITPLAAARTRAGQDADAAVRITPLAAARLRAGRPASALEPPACVPRSPRPSRRGKAAGPDHGAAGKASHSVGRERKSGGAEGGGDWDADRAAASARNRFASLRRQGDEEAILQEQSAGVAGAQPPSPRGSPRRAARDLLVDHAGEEPLLSLSGRLEVEVHRELEGEMRKLLHGLCHQREAPGLAGPRRQEALLLPPPSTENIGKGTACGGRNGRATSASEADAYRSMDEVRLLESELSEARGEVWKLRAKLSHQASAVALRTTEEAQREAEMLRDRLAIAEAEAESSKAEARRAEAQGKAAGVASPDPPQEAASLSHAEQIAWDLSIRSSATALSGLSRHADAARLAFAAPCVPARTAEVVETTWRFVQAVRQANDRWAAVRQHFGEATPLAPLPLRAAGLSWDGIAAEAVLAETRTQALARHER